MEKIRKTKIKTTMQVQVISTVLVAILLVNPSFYIPTASTNAITNQSTSKNTLIVALNSQVKDYNPLISNSAYDKYEQASTYLTLGLMTTPNGDLTFTQWQIFPLLAKSWISTPDGLNWTVTLNSGLTWQDGSPLTSTDVQFGLNATLDPATGSPSTGRYLDLFNNTAFSSPSPAAVQSHAMTIINATSFVLHFARFDPYQEANVAGILPMPYHQLKNEPFSNWSNDSYDSGVTPITGNGPYQYMNKSSDGNTAYLQAWSGWTSSYASKFASTGSYASNVPSIKNIIITVNNDPANAVIALKTGQIDYIDSQTALNTVFNQITAPAVAATYPAYGFQEMGLNMRSPIWGFNPLDPALDYNESVNYCSTLTDTLCTNTSVPTLASNPEMFMQELQGTVHNQNGNGTNIDEFFFQTLNATQRQWIRQAFDYSVDRQGIIDTNLGGHGYQIATRLLPQTGLVNTSLTARPYDLGIASKLLSQAFGYTFDRNGDDNPNTPWVNEALPYFKLTIVFPNSGGPSSYPWVSLIAAALTSIGIDVTIKSVTFLTLLDHIYYNNYIAPDGMYGVDNNHGGFDVVFAGWGGSAIPTSDGQFYASKYVAPIGNNYQFLNSSYMDKLVSIEETSSNATARQQAYYDEQTFIYQQALISIINQPQEIFAMNEYLKGFNPFDASSGALFFANLTYNVPVPDTSTVITHSSLTSITQTTSKQTTNFLSGIGGLFDSPLVIAGLIAITGFSLVAGSFLVLTVFRKNSQGRSNSIKSESNTEIKRKPGEISQLSPETLDLLQDIIDENKK